MPSMKQIVCSLRDAIGSAGFNATFEGEPPQMSKCPVAVLKLDSMTQDKNPCVEYVCDEDAPAGADLIPRYQMVNRATLSVTFESPSKLPGCDAMSDAISLRSKMFTHSFREALSEKGIAIRNLLSTTDISDSSDACYSRALLELSIEWCLTFDDCPITYIGSVELSPSYTHVDGAEIPAEPTTKTIVAPETV